MFLCHICDSFDTLLFNTPSQKKETILNQKFKHFENSGLDCKTSQKVKVHTSKLNQMVTNLRLWCIAIA